MAVGRTAAGVEGALLIHADGTLVTSATMLLTMGEMKLWLVDPNAPDDENPKWVKLDGSRLDRGKHPLLAEKYGDKALPKIDHMWAYAG